MNEPIGLSGALSPALFLWIALTTFSTASLCPIILDSMVFESLESLFFSDFTIYLTGTLVIIETTSAMSLSFTVTRFCFDSSFHFS